jgi:glycosyltransferase involved in cell wall biosynthesis
MSKCPPPLPIRVAVVVENHPRVFMGGAQYQGHLLAEEAARRSQVEVAYFARNVTRSGQDFRDLPYAVHDIGSGTGIRRRAVLFDAPKLNHALGTFRPHVVYQQMRQSYTAVCARHALRYRVPFFFQIASDIDLTRNWLTHHVSANTPFDVAESILGIWGLRRASHIIAQTGRQNGILRDRFGRSAAAVIRNFQPLPDALPHKPEGPVEVFWVANFKSVKRPELFVSLAEGFAGRTDVKFVMAGRASAEAAFEPLMKRISSTPNLEYLGEISIDEVNVRMSRAEVHVNTSSFEGFPNTFIQAWANGAVVLTLTVDPDEQSMESRGIGFCAGNVDRLRDLVETLIRDRARREAIQRRAFAFAHAHHSMQGGAQLVDLMLAAAHRPSSGS